jgi:hypothetical protein
MIKMKPKKGMGLTAEKGCSGTRSEIMGIKKLRQVAQILRSMEDR